MLLVFSFSVARLTRNLLSRPSNPETLEFRELRLAQLSDLDSPEGFGLMTSLPEPIQTEFGCRFESFLKIKPFGLFKNLFEARRMAEPGQLSLSLSL